VCEPWPMVGSHGVCEPWPMVGSHGVCEPWPMVGSHGVCEPWPVAPAEPVAFEGFGGGDGVLLRGRRRGALARDASDARTLFDLGVAQLRPPRGVGRVALIDHDALSGSHACIVQIGCTAMAEPHGVTTPRSTHTRRDDASEQASVSRDE
jgi:hypothetical protein